MSERLHKDIMVCGELNHEVVNDVWYTALHQEPRADQVTLYLCSPGGEFAAWSAVIDLLSTYRDCEQLCTVGMGEVASGAVPILASGSPGRRGIYRHAMVGLHEPFLDETTPDPAVQSSEMRIIEAMKARFYNLLAEYTNNRPSWWRKRLAGQSMVWIDARQAVRWRIVDHVLG
jgi:ATP-dependent protease ClpP protease subunit